MLISDWSSDVCSSDLLHGECNSLIDQPPRFGWGLLIQGQGVWAVEHTRRAANNHQAGAFPCRLVQQFGGHEVNGAVVVAMNEKQRRTKPFRVQIGRASCRERGGQYG